MVDPSRFRFVARVFLLYNLSSTRSFNLVHLSQQDDFHSSSSPPRGEPDILQMTNLRVYLFGKFEVYASERIIQEKYWQSRQVRTIFKFLVVHRERVVSHEQLLELLWPNEDPAVAQERLYIRISQLRQVLKKIDAPVCLETVEGGYVLESCSQADSDLLWIDTETFEKLADQGRQSLEKNQYRDAIDLLQQAQQLYRGEYLAEDQYKDWSTVERERLRDRYLTVLTELSEAYAQLGQYRRAINTCQTILHNEPYREAAFVRLMLFYYYAGEKTKALKTFEQCRTTLLAELAVEPDPSTIEIASQIQNGTFWNQDNTPLYPPPDYEGRMYEVPYILGELPLIGRDREYAWLINHWRSTPGCSIFVDGEAGVGKSRLVETFAGYLQSQGTIVFTAKGIHDQQTPYDVFLRTRQMCSSTEKQTPTHPGETFRKMLHAFEQTASDQESSHITTWIKDFYAQFPLETVFIVDDAQWMDPSSLAVIGELLGLITFVLVFRHGEELSVLKTGHLFLKNHQTAPPLRLTLSRLTAPDVKALVKHLSGSDLPSLSNLLYQKTDGNPLFVVAFLQNLFEQGNLFVDSYGNWIWLEEKTIDPIPDLNTMIMKRLQGLRPEERRILDGLAIAGGETDFAVLQAMLDIEEMTLIAVVDSLIERTFVIEPRLQNSAELILSHGLYAEAITHTMPHARKKIVHRRFAESLVQLKRNTPENAALIARHARLGENNQLALFSLKDAAQYALRLYLPHQADQYFSQALELLEQHPHLNQERLHGELIFGKAESQRLMGNFKEALSLYLDSFPHLDPVSKQISASQIFQLNFQIGEKPEGFEARFSRVQQTLLETGDSWALFFMFLSQAFMLLLHGKMREVLEFNRKAWAVSRRLNAQGDPCPDWLRQRALIVLARIHIQQGNFLTAKRICNRLLKHTQENGPLNNRAAAHAWMGEACLGLSEYQAAFDHFSLAFKIAEKANDLRSCNEARIGLGKVNFETGNFEEAFSLMQVVLKTSQKNQDKLRQGYAVILMAKLGLKTKIKHDVFPELLTFLSIATKLETTPYTVMILAVLIEICLANGETEQAALYLQEAIPLAQQGRLNFYQGVLARFSAILESGTAREQALQTALSLAQKCGCLYEMGMVIRTQADLTCEQKTRLSLYTQSAEIFQKIGAAAEVQVTQDLIAALGKE